MKRSNILMVLSILFCMVFLPAFAYGEEAPLPRVLVYLTGEEVDTPQSVTEEVISSMGFKIFDRNQIQNIKDVDEALSTNDKGKLLALKHRYGIEIIITGVAKKDSKDERKVYGRTYVYFKPYVTMKAIVSDTAEIIYSKSLRGTETARSNALDNLTKEVAKIMGEKIKAYWAKASFDRASYDVVISKISYSQLTSLEDHIKGTSRILGHARRNYAKETAFYEITYRGSRTDLENDLLKCSSPSLQVVRTTANRIELEVGAAAPVKDTTPPNVKISDPASDIYTGESKITVKGTASDSSGISKVTVNGSEATLKGNDFECQVELSSGSNKITATAWDNNGNQASASINITMDNTAPVVKITYPTSGLTINKKSIEVSGTVSDTNLQGVVVQGVVAEIKDGKFTARIDVQDGNINITAIAKDLAGNMATDIVKIKVDTRPPEVTFKVLIQGTVDKEGSRVWVNGDEVQVVDGTWKTYIDILKVKKIEIVAVDPSGNRTVQIRNLGE